jgi:hypothetical protein
VSGSAAATSSTVQTNVSFFKQEKLQQTKIIIFSVTNAKDSGNFTCFIAYWKVQDTKVGRTKNISVEKL